MRLFVNKGSRVPSFRIQEKCAKAHGGPALKSFMYGGSLGLAELCALAAGFLP